jgi:hypothetical protein
VITWRHVKPDPSHPVDPHHSGTGKWVCYACRQPVADNGKSIDMSWKGLDGLLTGPQSVDPEQPGLQVEGS